ncbi:MAG: branched-chain amino acid ABC transporter substrate-binding protein [Acidimicrobiales bacterium]
MRKWLMKAGVPLVAGALVLTTFSGAAFANAKHPAATMKPTFDIAYEGPLSGGDAQLGLNMLYAVELAVNQANSGMSQFGKLPFTLAFVKKDDQGLGTISPTDAQELVSNKAVVGVIGPAFSAAVEAAEPTFSTYDLATVSPSATRVTLADHGWKNFFRVVANDGVQAPSDANWAMKTLHVHKVYVVSDATTYGVPLAGAFAAQAKKDGMSVTSIAFPATAQCGQGTASPTEYTDDAASVVAANPQLLFYGGYYCDLGLLITALHKAGYKGKIMSGDGSDSIALIAGTNPHSAANGVFTSCGCAALGTTKVDKAFASGFKALAHFAPAIYSAEAYDASNTVIDEMKILSSEKGGTANITRENIVLGLHKISFHGITKVISFEANGEIVGSGIYINQVQNGKLVQLGLE